MYEIWKKKSKGEGGGIVEPDIGQIYDEGFDDGVKYAMNALEKACKYIVDYTGGCPLANKNHDMDCEKRCSDENEWWTCWYDYFKEL